MLGANAIRNPWSSASKLEDFQYFLCPECNEKEKLKEDFVKHALGQHKLAANYISELIVKEEFFESNNDENNVEYSSDIEDESNNTNYDIGKEI